MCPENCPGKFQPKKELDIKMKILRNSDFGTQEIVSSLKFKLSKV